MKHLLCLLLLLLSGCCVATNPGEGVKIGRIVKLSRQGLVSKTWEGELLRGGISDGSGSMGSSFEFTIEDDYLVKKAQSLLESGSEVVLTYRIEGIWSICRSENYPAHFVTEIRTTGK